MNRITYIVRLMYWFAVHRNWSRAVWVVAHEGHQWK